MIKNKGFSLVEIIISLAIFSIILFVVISFFLSMNTSNTKTKADREVSENAKTVLEKIAYEIRSAKSIYTPTSSANQLSLETSRYLPSGESNTYIDFFLCGTAICFKQEFKDAVVLTADSVNVTSLVFSQVSTGSVPSVQISLSVNSAIVNDSSSISLTSTASIRSY